MKLFYSLLFLAILPIVSNAQCNVLINPTNTGCFGGSDGTAQAIPTGTSPFTYLWSPGNQTSSTIFGLSAGTYTVTMTDANMCVATATVTITSPAMLSPTITAVAPSCGTCCDGSASIIVSGGIGPYTYQWMPTGGTSTTITGLCSGTYTCCVTDAAGCSTCNQGNCPFCQTSINLSPATGQNEIPIENDLSVFPIPATQFVTVKESFANSLSAVISITNVLGETVYTKSVSGVSELNENINVADLNSGVYFISVKTASGTTVRRFVKE